MTEEWRVWPGNPKYEVSSLGGVRRSDTKRIRKPSIIKHGYGTIRHTHESKVITSAIHRMVVETFIGPIPEGMVICHNDGDKLNNSVGNLRIDTQKGNMADKIPHRTHNFGEVNGSAKLTWADIEKIRLDPRINRLVAEDYGVHEETIRQARVGKSWRFSYE